MLQFSVWHSVCRHGSQLSASAQVDKIRSVRSSTRTSGGERIEKASYVSYFSALSPGDSGASSCGAVLYEQEENGAGLVYSHPDAA